MNFWFSFGLVVAFASFIHIESKEPHVEVGDEPHVEVGDEPHVEIGDEGLIPLDNYPDNYGDQESSPETNLQNVRTSKNLRVAMNSGTKTLRLLNVQLEGEYFWKLLYYVDNTNRDNPFKETHTFKKEVTTSYTELKESVSDRIEKYGVSLSVGGIFEVISADITGSVDVELRRSYKSTVEQKSNTYLTEEIVQEFTVGANSIGEMYRLIYVGPGVNYESATVSTNGTYPLHKVRINCNVRRIPMIKGIFVRYTHESVSRPDDLITETNGLSPDVNDGFRGMFVWLVPIWTLNKDEAVTKIEFVLQHQPNSKYQNLAETAGGAYRYLKMLRNYHQFTRIYRIGLLRSSNWIYEKIHEYGWDECTLDINNSRRGDFLFLCWNNISVL